MKVFTASLKDIEKALVVKKWMDPRVKLPEHYHEHLLLFDMKIVDWLPPYWSGINYKIEFEKDENGHEKMAPWGPFITCYGKNYYYSERPLWNTWIRILSELVVY